MRSLAAVVLAAPLLLLPPAAARGAETSLRCGGGIVSLGDHTIDLLGKCGQPTLREGGEQVTTFVPAGAGARRATAITVERWTYDFGPQSFLMFVTLRGGKVSAIERGGYGYGIAAPPPAPLRRATCDASALREGLSRLDVLARCGEPTLAERRDDLVRLTGETASGTVVTQETPVVVEVWTYDFGPQSLVRLVHLEDGVVRHVATGGYGYTR
jgi:hypothetical protein